MRPIFVLAAASLTALAANAPAAAVTIAGLYNTGVDNVGTATTGNGADSHWLLTGGTAYTGGTNGNFPIGPWLAETAVSRWLTPGSDAANSFDPTTDGFYDYTLSFDLTGFKPGTASFAGRFAADNSVSQITLNGTPITGSGGGFGSWTAFSSAGGFLAGANTVTFTVKNNFQKSGNPTGLRVEFTGSDAVAVPEAATWTMLIAGFGLVGIAARRRRPVAA